MIAAATLGDVMEEHRDEQGAARHDLVDHRGAERVILEVRADNDAARALYAGAGFTTLQTRRGYYPGGVDALVLALDLGDDRAKVAR